MRKEEKLLRYGARGLGARLQASREVANLTQIEVATKIGTSVNSLSRWENDEATVPERYMLAMARLYDRQLSWFLTGQEPDHTSTRLLSRWSALSLENQKLVFQLMEALGQRPKAI